MVVDDENEVSGLLKDFGIGYLTHSKEDVLTHLTNLYTLWQAGEMPDYQYSAENYSRSVQAEKYAMLIKQILEHQNIY